MGEQAIVDLVHVRKVNSPLPLRVFVVHAHFIMKDGVETDVLEIGNLLHAAKVAAITFAQGNVCALRAEHLFPEGMCGNREVDDDEIGTACRRMGLCAGDGHPQKQK